MTQTAPKTGPAQSGNGRTVHRVRIDSFHLNALCGRSADRRLTDREAARMGKTCVRCAAAEEKLLAPAPVEEAPAPAPAEEAPAETGPRIHHFADSSTAYDAAQSSDEVKDGDVLVIASEGIVGALTNAWPVALTEAHGDLHPMAARYRIHEMNDGRYRETADLAQQAARELGVSLLPQHAAPAPAEEKTVTPEWRTLKGVQAPFQMFGTFNEAGTFVPASDRNRVTGRPVTITETWMRGTRYGRLLDGTEVHLWGVATKYWVAPGAAPAEENPAPAPAPAEDAPAAPAQEEAPAQDVPADSRPTVRRYDSTDDAYDRTEAGEVNDGDVLVVESERAVAVAMRQYAVAVTVETGEFHGPKGLPHKMAGGRYAASVEMAVKVAQELGFAVRPSALPAAGLDAEQAGEDAARYAELTAEAGVRSAVAARNCTAHGFQEVKDRVGSRIGWTYRFGFGAHARYGWATVGGRISEPNHGSTYRWEADRDLRQVHADGAGDGPDNLLTLLSDAHRPTLDQLTEMLDALQAADTVRLHHDGTGKWTVQRGPHFMGIVLDEGARMRRGRYVAWAPYTDRRDGIVGFFHDRGDARDAVAAAWPVEVAEVAGEAGVPVQDVLAAAEALDVELRKADGRAVVRAQGFTGADARITQDAAAAIRDALPASVALVADRAGLTRDEVLDEAADLASAWHGSGEHAVWRSTVAGQNADLSPAAAVVLLHRLALPYHGPAWYTGERAICGYDDHTAPLNDDGRLAVHERRPGVYGHCPGSLLAPRTHRDEKTRQWTTALSYSGPRPDALAGSAKPGDAVKLDGTEYGVEDVQADLDTRQHVHLVLSNHAAPLRFTLDERVTYTRRVRKQDVACQECGVYVVLESDEATDGSLTGRLCGVCDRPDAEMTEDRARELAAAVWPEAEAFQPERDEDGRLLGYTFRAGRLHSARFGWIAPSGTVCQRLKDYRSHAGALLPMVARDEREARRNPAV